MFADQNTTPTYGPSPPFNTVPPSLAGTTSRGLFSTSNSTTRVEEITPRVEISSEDEDNEAEKRDYMFSNRSAKKFKVDEGLRACSSVRKRNLMDDRKMRRILKTKCCSLGCTGKLTMAKLRSLRENYSSMSIADQNGYLAMKVRPDRNGFLHYLSNYHDPVCQKCFMLVHRLGATRISRIHKRLDKNPRIDDHCGPKRVITMYALAAVSWMENYFKETCEKLPNSEMFHLTDNITKKDVYQEYKDNCTLPQHISYSHFTRLWKAQFNLVKIPRKHRMAVCSRCAELKSQKETAKTEADRSKPQLSNTC